MADESLPRHGGASSSRWIVRTILIGVFVSLSTGWCVSFLAAEVVSNRLSRTDVGVIAGLSMFAAICLVSITLWIPHRRRGETLARISVELRAIARGERDALTDSGDGRRDPFTALFRDVASSIRKQRTILNQQQHSLEEILNGMGEGLLAIDEEKRIVLANERLRTMFALVQPRIGRLFYEVVRNATVIEAFDSGLRGESGVFRSLVTVSGEERQIEIRIFPTTESSDIAVVALFIDVTRLERLARIRRDFVSDFSHEVRTPLAGIRSSIETIQESSISEDQRTQLLHILDRQLGRLERLVSDLAELNTIESGEMILHREPTELRQLLIDLSTDFFEGAAGGNVSIIVEGEESIANVDPVRIEQVFANLVDNAIKHAPGSDVRIDVVDDETMTEVRVTDQGSGIPKGETEKVFHRFYRIDKSRSSRSAGTGLGLAITKHLVIQHGGSIGVESEIGKGTTFIVRLPKR